MSQDNKGFFKKFHETVNSSLDDVTTNNFVNLETNAKRVSYLCSLPAVKEYDLSVDVLKCETGGTFPVKKDLEKARFLKEEGNKAVQKGEWSKAMQFYGQSMVYMPEKESKFTSLVSNVIHDNSIITNILCLRSFYLKKCRGVQYLLCV